MCDATVITSCLRADNCHMMSQVCPLLVCEMMASSLLTIIFCVWRTLVCSTARMS